MYREFCARRLASNRFYQHFKWSHTKSSNERHREKPCGFQWLTIARLPIPAKLRPNIRWERDEIMGDSVERMKRPEKLRKVSLFFSGFFFFISVAGDRGKRETKFCQRRESEVKSVSASIENRRAEETDRRRRRILFEHGKWFDSAPSRRIAPPWLKKKMRLKNLTQCSHWLNPERFVANLLVKLLLVARKRKKSFPIKPHLWTSHVRSLACFPPKSVRKFSRNAEPM